MTIVTGKGYMLGAGTNTYISRETSGGNRYSVTVNSVEALKIMESDQSAIFSSTITLPNSNIFTGNANSVSISKGLHIGGASDVSDNNLLVDGTITATGNLIASAYVGSHLIPSAVDTYDL